MGWEGIRDGKGSEQGWEGKGRDMGKDGMGREGKRSRGEGRERKGREK